ncbi:MAG: hypothetical protein IJF67_00345 [Clostridia bacterium]|nr:hypothetical protein [Clostridia bacterium]
MKKRNSMICLLLAGLLLQLAATACGGEAAPAGDTTAAPGTESAAPETTARITDLPEDYDLGGYELRILKQDPEKLTWILNTFAPEEENGDVLNDAFYKRNQQVTEHYNFKISETLTSGNPAGAVQTSVLAGEDLYDAVLSCLNESNALFGGLCMNLYDVPNLDVTKPYWNTNVTEALTLNGALYMTTGDILASDDDGMMMLTYNRPLAEEFKIPNLYDVVRSGKWTYDEMAKYIKMVSQDLDNNGTYDEKDRYGLMYAIDAAAAPYFGATQTYIYEKKDSGYPEFVGNSERAHDVFAKFNAILGDNKLSYEWSRLTGAGYSGAAYSAKVAGMLNDKQVLFQSMILSMVRRNYRDIELDFGILVLPKLDENQKEYSTIINLATPYLFVPKTVKSLDKAGFALEALAAASEDIARTYYEICLQSKYTRDAESYEMIELAAENIVFDLGFVFNWGGLTGNIRQNIMVKDSNYASMVASLSTAADEAMKKFVDAQGE